MRTKSAMEKQIEAIEAVLLPLGDGATSAWFAWRLKDAQQHEDALNAASIMVIHGVLAEPSPAIHERLHTRFQTDCRQWPDSRLIFALANEGLISGRPANEHWVASSYTDEGQNTLCWAALVCFQVLAELPLPSTPQARQYRQDTLFSEILMPWLTMVCPEMAGRALGDYREWLESAKRTPQSELARSLRTFSASSLEAQHG